MYHEVSDIQKELATPSKHVTALFLPPVEVPHMYHEYIPLTNSSKRVVSPPPPPPLVDTTPENEELSDKISHEEQEDLDEDPLDMADVLQELLQSQQMMNKTIADAMAQLVTALGNNNAANDKRLLAETVYDEFKSSDYPADSHLA